MKHIVFSLVVFLIGSVYLDAQNVSLGIEAQKYPAGHILGGRIDIGVGDQNDLNFRVGYNFARHQDFGVHEDETGGGWGGSLGFRHYFNPEKTKWFLGIRTDVWFNTIDWKDFIGMPNELRGTTDITVLQPVIEGGYGFLLNKNLFLAPSISFGYEWNARVEGEEVGEGAILLGGVQLSYRF